MLNLSISGSWSSHCSFWINSLAFWILYTVQPHRLVLPQAAWLTFRVLIRSAFAALVQPTMRTRFSSPLFWARDLNFSLCSFYRHKLRVKPAARWCVTKKSQYNLRLIAALGDGILGRADVLAEPRVWTLLIRNSLKGWKLYHPEKRMRASNRILFLSLRVGR